MTAAEPLDHQALMAKALVEIRDLRAKLRSAEQSRHEPVAVVGLGCRFPGAADPAAFWELLREGRDAVREIPPDRWDVEAYYHPDPAEPGKMYTRWGGFLAEIDGFSPAFFGISPREAASMDPQQRLLLEVCWEALENAAVAPDRLPDGRVGVFVGAGATDFTERMVMSGPASIDPYNGTGTAASVSSGRLSYLLGVRGPSVSLDTACSSSLTAVHLAVRSLRERESDLALAGGVNMILSPDSLVSLCKARMLSPVGRCKTFDASADGYVRAEGCGVLVLKRLADALAAGDHVHAVVRGTALNHNGRSSGLTVPSGPAQQSLIRDALADAGLKPAEVRYVEAHGTGTAVGDPIEVGALAGVFAGHPGPLLVGSVKSNVGHLEWAAGVCGLIKVILAMRHDRIPPSLHLKTPNPLLDWDRLPLRVVTELTPWPDGPRVAGVSSFGFGGTNAHVLVEQPPAPAAVAATTDRPQHLLTLSAKTPEALRSLAGRYAAHLGSADPSALADICHTANTGRVPFDHRLACVVGTTAELTQRLDEVAAGRPAGVQFGRAPTDRPRIAMLFTGQGSQYADMGRELFDTQPAFRRTLEECDTILRGVLDRPLLEVLFPPDGADAAHLIDQTAYTQPALFAVEYALATLWRGWGVRPTAVIGHSVGEYVAACVAGVFGLEDGLRLIAERGRLMQALPAGGAMLAVKAAEDEVRRVIASTDGVGVAAVNGPREVVVSGDRRAVEALAERFRGDGIAAQPLTVSHAFHSPLMEPMLADFERAVQRVRFREPELDVISNLTGRPARGELTDPAYWVRHVRQPVRFADGFAALAAGGCDIFLEVGPHPVLLGLGKQSAPESTAAWLPSLRRGRGAWPQVLESVAALAVRGVPIDWKAFDAPYPRRKVELPTYPFERQRFPLPATDRGQPAAPLRPLAETVVRSPLVREAIIATPISVARQPYLADHKVLGEVVAPAACYLAAILNGTAHLGMADRRPADVFFVAPLVLAAGEERTLQAVIDPDGGFKVISFADGDPTTHVSGRLVEGGTADATTDALADARGRCTEPVDVDAMLAGLDGIAFGPCFRWIEELWAGNGESLARLRRPAAVASTDGYQLHPGLLDACFQAAGGSLDDPAAGVLLPFGVKRLDLVRPAVGDAWWCHARRVADLTWDIDLLDDAGELVARVSGFELRAVTGDSVHARRSADWLYRVDWQPQPRTASAAADGSWLVLDRPGGFGDELAGRLRAHGGRVVVSDNGDTPRLTEASAVVVLCDGGEHDPPRAAEAFSVGLLRLVHELTAAGVTPRVWVVTAGSQAVRDGDTVSVAPAAVWGMVRTLQLEAPALRCGCIDLPARPAAEDLDALAAELTAPTAETQVALRGGERFVARLARHPLAESAADHGPFALQLSAYGSPDNLRLVPRARRAPGPGEVEIEVKAAALNFRDVLLTLGMLRDYYERVMNIHRAEDVPLGFDSAGVVAAVGAGVTDLRVGDEVMTTYMGGFASFALALRTDVVPKPAGLSFEAAAALPTVFLTAHYGLCQLAALKPGERVLIHAAAGGVGQAAVQIAQAVGAEVFATASPGKWELLKGQGVRHVMNSRALDFADEVRRLTGGAGVDVVLNTLTGEAVGKSFDALAAGGRFVELGLLGVWTREQAAAHRPDVAYHPFDLYRAVGDDPTLPARSHAEMRAWFAAGRLRPLPATVFPARDAVAAYRLVQHAKHVGKVVLSFAADPPPVRADASYLVTGGLGALGLRTAGQLAALGARHLVLAGRSEPSAEARDAIRELQTDGVSVRVAAADVTRADDVARLVEACEADAPLRGVVHAAGVLDDGAVGKQTAERFAGVLAPKAAGGWHLHAATQHRPLDFFVTFSSMASVLGSAGQTNYAAGNAVLDALAHHRRARGLPALSVNWGPWAEAGMAAKLSLAGQGVEKLAISDGLRVFGELLRATARGGPPQVGVWRVQWPAFQRRLPAGEVPPFLSAFVRQAAAAKPESAGDFLTRFRATPEGERAALLEAAIRKELLDVLGQPPTEPIAATQLWADLGLDSLMTVDLKNRLDTLFRLTIPLDKMARDVSTRSLAAFVRSKMDDGPAPTAVVGTGAAPPAELSESDIHLLAQEIPQLFVTVDEQKGRRVRAGGRWRYDFASCNYLGLDLHPEVAAAVPPAVAAWGTHPSWTRAVASPRLYTDLERDLAEFVAARDTLVFPSISLLHMGVLPALAGFDGVILKDTDAHHSVHEGCLRAQANGAEWVNFPHGDAADLARRLARYRPGRTKVIATDGVFSMGSSHPPLAEYARLAKAHNAILYVDDAHGFGVIGESPDADSPYGYRGNGLVRHLGLDYAADRIVYIAGLSKAFSSYAAFVTCSDDKLKWDLQAAGPYAFSGPTCVASLATARAGLRVNAREGDALRRTIYRLTHRLVTGARELGFEVDNGDYFPVVGVVVGGFEHLMTACGVLWDHDILITPAFYPAVPLHRSLVRFSVTAVNTDAEVEHALRALKAVRDRQSVPGNGVARRAELVGA